MESGHIGNCLHLPVIKNLPGLILLQNKQNSNDDEQGIVGWNRCMAYHSLNSTPTNVYRFYRRLPTFSFTAKSELQRKKNYRHHVNILRRLFAVNKNENTIKYNVGQYSLQTCIDNNQCCLITQARQEDIYHPVAFLQDNKLIGGLQINVSLYMAKDTNTEIIPIDRQPITSIVTSMCMYGSNVKLVDNSGHEHLMTVTPNALTKDQIIVDIIEKHQLHPYEKLDYKTFENLIPLFYILGNGIIPTIYFHLPTAEYIIHALDLLLSGNMTITAFHQNIDYIIRHTRIYYQWLTHFCSQNNIQLVTKTPMEKLVLQDDGNFCLQSFLNRIQVPIDLLNTSQVNLNLSAFVAERCWIWLSQSQIEPHGSIWKFMMDKNTNFTQDNVVDMNSLQSLKYLSYTVQIAATKQMPNSKRTLVALSFREKQISRSYKNLLANEYGSILGLHWMIPILSNISNNSQLYYSQDYLDLLDQLIESDIVSHCLLETGAAAIKTDNEEIYSYSKAKAQMLSEHQTTVEQQIHSSSTIIDS